MRPYGAKEGHRLPLRAPMDRQRTDGSARRRAADVGRRRGHCGVAAGAVALVVACRCADRDRRPRRRRAPDAVAPCSRAARGLERKRTRARDSRLRARRATGRDVAHGSRVVEGRVVPEERRWRARACCRRSRRDDGPGGRRQRRAARRRARPDDRRARHRLLRLIRHRRHERPRRRRRDLRDAPHVVRRRDAGHGHRPQQRARSCGAAREQGRVPAR